MEQLILVLVFLGTVMLLVGTYTFVNRRRLQAAEATRTRLTGGVAAVSDIRILKDDRVSGLAVLNRLLANRSLTEALARELERAGSRQKPGEFVMITAVCAAAGVLIGQRLGFVFAILGAVLLGGIPFVVLRVRQGRRLHKLESQLPDAIDMLVNALKAGYSLQAAMEFVGKEMPEPLGPEFARFYDEQRLGVDMRTALLAMQERVGTSDVKMFVTSLLIQRETGGNLSEVLNNLATLIRDRVAFRGHVKTLTAEPMLSAKILTVLPVALFFLFLSLNRTYMNTLLVTERGQYMIAYAVCSIIVGYFVMMRIARIEL